jgi:hypothetical protein
MIFAPMGAGCERGWRKFIIANAGANAKNGTTYCQAAAPSLAERPIAVAPFGLEFLSYYSQLTSPPDSVVSK